ncbi:hypothetical protein U2A4042370100 [Corynebacterium striatum]|nr:hypothetical protein U2A4042370100 [Corynebacterium striatum]
MGFDSLLQNETLAKTGKYASVE